MPATLPSPCGGRPGRQSGNPWAPEPRQAARGGAARRALGPGGVQTARREVGGGAGPGQQCGRWGPPSGSSPQPTPCQTGGRWVLAVWRPGERPQRARTPGQRPSQPGPRGGQPGTAGGRQPSSVLTAAQLLCTSRLLANPSGGLATCTPAEERRRGCRTARGAPQPVGPPSGPGRRSEEGLRARSQPPVSCGRGARTPGLPGGLLGQPAPAHHPQSPPSLPWPSLGGPPHRAGGKWGQPRWAPALTVA